jgi:hypothetical protein
MDMNKGNTSRFSYLGGPAWSSRSDPCLSLGTGEPFTTNRKCRLRNLYWAQTSYYKEMPDQKLPARLFSARPSVTILGNAPDQEIGAP